MRKLLLATVLAAMTAGSATAWADTSAPTATGLAATQISYEKSGGFAGINREITVTRDGEVRVSDTMRTGRFQAAADELRSLRRKLDAISAWRSSSKGCEVADHFAYRLSYRGRQATRCHELPADWRSAVTQLEELIDRGLADRPAE
ncbi:hypothetical protein HS041_26775 [Planomonospora sp. ID67723]|uniref:hypothetical protein n=1 Tax=Planomonospora sp. ID67723 TaxID=2738134 RepID=UPI0018C417D3|nr:hypothetical protein [Planomonospora sp. ID67723]MBG0831355.1 hypothetical protein [Planomonospora sp. ID67723]